MHLIFHETVLAFSGWTLQSGSSQVLPQKGAEWQQSLNGIKLSHATRFFSLNPGKSHFCRWLAKLLHLHVPIGIPIPAQQASGDIRGARRNRRLMVLPPTRGSTPPWGTSLQELWKVQANLQGEKIKKKAYLKNGEEIITLVAVQAKITAKIIKSHAPGRKLIAHRGQEDIFIHCRALHSWLLRCYYERGKWKEEGGVCLGWFFFLLKERQEWLLFALKHQELAGIRDIIPGWLDTVWQH